MAAAKLVQTMTVGALTLQGETTHTEDGVITQTPSLPAANAGTLTTRTDDDTGEVTSVGHDIEIGDKVDVYWAAGIRYGMSVTNVVGNVISIDLGAGDVLPAQDTDVVIDEQIVIDTDFDGDLLKMIGVCLATTTRGHAHFTENDDTSIEAVELTEGELWSWCDGIGQTNPLTGNPVGKLKVSNGTTTAGQIKMGALYNSAT